MHTRCVVFIPEYHRRPCGSRRMHPGSQTLCRHPEKMPQRKWAKIHTKWHPRTRISLNKPVATKPHVHGREGRKATNPGHARRPEHARHRNHVRQSKEAENKDHTPSYRDSNNKGQVANFQDTGSEGKRTLTEHVTKRAHSGIPPTHPDKVNYRTTTN